MFSAKNMEETFECGGFGGIELDIEIRQRRKVWHFIILLSLHLKNCHWYVLLSYKIISKNTFLLNCM